MGLAIAVIIHIVATIAAIMPTVNGGYARYNASNTTGTRTVSIQSAPRLFFLVIRIDKKNPPPMITNVVMVKVSGAFRGLAVGIADSVNVEHGSSE